MFFIICVSVGFAVWLPPVNGSDDSKTTTATATTTITTTISPHCFKRISSGERLIAYDVTRIIQQNSVKGCEEECYIYKCTYFSFGNVTDVNSTCELTTDREIARRHDPNFDLYEITDECVEGKPRGYEEACYRRIVTGKRLHERYIRHSLPCNSLEACQHQCSIEKHFDCQGFNVRLDSARVGRGICELSSIATHHLDWSQDFVYDTEFAYYERDQDNSSPNCGHFNSVPNVVPPYNPEENIIGYQPTPNGGPYYGGDSYGPWSSGHGTIDNGPWGSHGYGSGFYESNNPASGPPPPFHSNTPFQGPHGYGSGSHVHGGGSLGHEGGSNGYGGATQGFGDPHGYRGGSPAYGAGTYGSGGGSYGYGSGYGYGGSFGYGNWNVPLKETGYFPQPYPSHSRGQYPNFPPKLPDFQGAKSPPTWGPPKYPSGDRRYDKKPNGIPTYIIIDADVNRGAFGGGQPGHGHGNRRPVYPPNRPGPGYLPARPALQPPSRPLLPSPPPQSPSIPQPPPRPQPPRLPPPAPLPSPPRPFYGSPRPPFSPGTPPRSPPEVLNREVCFRREHPGYKLNPTSIRGMYETPSVLDCEAMCTNSPFKCTAYSFRYSSSSSGPNCLLTDFTSLNRDTHLLPDRSCDVYFKMSTCMDIDRMVDAECFLKVAANRKLDPGRVVKMVPVGGMSDCELACLNSGFFTCRSFSFRHGPGVIGEPIENCFLSDWPISALTHLDFVPMPNHEVYERGSFGHGCELDSGPTLMGPRPPFMPYPNIPQITHAKDPWAISDTWRHFTVNGWPCRAGTECQLNPEAGFWTCEVEGGDRAQWDYCCRPKHSCGFSRGYNYQWCYVGEAGPDQWRPCSEYYYPEFDNRYTYKPVQAQTPHPHDSYGPPRDTRPWNFGHEEYGPPRYWPISYLYAEPPPNETYHWNPEEHHYHYEEHPAIVDHYYEPHAHVDDTPRIKFKPCGHKFPYPRAIIQKLDLKNIPKAGDPGEQLKKDEKPRIPKSEKMPDEPELGFSPENQKLKDEVEFFPSRAPPHGNTTKHSEPNETTRSKEVIKTVEKIIMESTTKAEMEANETLKKVETKHPAGFFSLSLLEEPEFWN